MNFTITLSEKSTKILDKMKSKDKANFEKLVNSLKKLERNPESFGKPLTGNLRGLWSYRTGDLRIIYQLQKESNTVFVVTVGHRRGIYG